MMRVRLPSFGALAMIVMLAFGLIAVRAGKSQTGDQSAGKLIHFLTDSIDPFEKSDLLDKNGARIAAVDRAAANSLVALGSAAIDDLNAAFDQIERQGEETTLAENSRWLLFAYARIRGADAYPRLRGMTANPKLRFLRYDLDHALAIALVLTSYVSASRVASRFICCRAQEPRHSLERLILAWMQGNLSWMEEELGPHARLALGSLLANRRWVDLQNELWHGATDSDVALGFRFESPGDWSEPEETLDQELQDRRRSPNIDQFPTEPELVTQFVDRAGYSCTKREIRFVRVPRGPGRMGFKYVVDDEDLASLLRTISGCAALRSP